MAGFGEYVVGSEALIAKLKDLQAKQSKAALRKATRAGAKVVLQKTRELVPVRSGRLRRAIKIRQKTGLTSITATVQIKTGDVFWGPFVEYGTKYQKGQSFFADAADISGQQALSTALDTLAAEIETWGSK